MRDLTVGAVVADRFEIEELAGAGGMGTVYRARDRATGGRVALKVSSEAHDRFRREASLLESLRHPGIVAYVGSGPTSEGGHYLAMAWLEGETLARRLAAGPLRLTQTVTLARHLARTLAALHPLGVVHRDIKPQNVFLRDGRLDDVVLLDLGVARGGPHPGLITQTGAIVGTPAYMSPEQARGDRDVGPAADVFSVGCLLYCCLTGQPPFLAEHLTAVLTRILFDRPVPVDELRPATPRALVRLVARQLEKEPGARPVDGAALLAALDELGPMPDEDGAPVVLPPRDASEPTELLGLPPAAVRAWDPRSLSVVVAAPPRAEDAGPDGGARAALRADLGRMGADVEWLRGGVLVAAFGRASAATDQVALAARGALAVRERWPDAAVALCTGRGAAGAGEIPVGEVVDRALALLPAGAPGRGVRLDELSAALLRDPRFVVEDGELRGELDAALELRPLLGKATPFVGRDQELAMLLALIESCAEVSEPRAALVVAPPGFGKSRLRQELARRLPADLTVLDGRSDVMAAGSPYALVAGALRAHLGHDAAELLARLGDRRLAEFLGEICHVPFPAGESVQLRAARHDPKIMADQVTQAFIDFIVATAERRPLLFIIEDLHWGDALSVKLLDAALREARGRRFMVLAFARPEVHTAFPELWSDHDVQELALRALSRRACEQLVVHVLGPELGRAHAARLSESSGGNVLFLEEVIRAVAGGGGEALPDTVLAMLQARFSRLSPNARRVLRAASVFGRTFWRGGVLSLLGHGPGSAGFDGDLEALVDAELTERQRAARFAGETEYRFRHALMRDAAYDLLAEDERRRAHRQAAAYLEQAGETAPLVFAEHFRLGDAPDRAVRAYLQAADEAVASNDAAAALEHAGRGLAAGAEGDSYAALRGVVCEASYLTRAQLARDAGVEALRLLPPGGERWCRTLSAMFFVAVMAADRRLSEELIARWLGVEPAEDARVRYLEAGGFLVASMSLFGVRADCEEVVRRLDALRRPDADVLSVAWVELAHTYFARNYDSDPWRTVTQGEVTVAALEQAGALRVKALVQSTLGHAQVELGDEARGEETVRAAVALARRLRDPILILHTQTDLVRVLAARPSRAAHAEAAGHIEELLAFDAMNAVYRGVLEGARAQLHLQQGNSELAASWARAATATLQLCPVLRFPVSATLARALVAQGLAEQALALLADEAEVLERLGGGFSELDLRAAIVEVRAAAGDAAGAEEAARVARARLLARAACIPDPALRQRYLARSAPAAG